MSTKNFPPQIWYAYVQNDPVNFRDLWGLSATDSNQQSVTKVRVETSGVEINLLTLSIGDTSLPVNGGMMKADFYLNDATTPSFSAEYYYYVSSKQGFEITVGGGALIAGTGYKTFQEDISNLEIARDFTSAVTVSTAGGFSSNVGAGLSYSSSGDWNYTQYSIGGSLSGAPVLFVTEHTNTFIKKSSEKQLERAER